MDHTIVAQSPDTDGGKVHETDVDARDVQGQSGGEHHCALSVKKVVDERQDHEEDITDQPSAHSSHPCEEMLPAVAPSVHQAQEREGHEEQLPTEKSGLGVKHRVEGLEPLPREGAGQPMSQPHPECVKQGEHG